MITAWQNTSSVSVHPARDGSISAIRCVQLHGQRRAQRAGWRQSRLSADVAGRRPTLAQSGRAITLPRGFHSVISCAFPRQFLAVPASFERPRSRSVVGHTHLPSHVASRGRCTSGLCGDTMMVGRRVRSASEMRNDGLLPLPKHEVPFTFRTHRCTYSQPPVAVSLSLDRQLLYSTFLVFLVSC